MYEEKKKVTEQHPNAQNDHDNAEQFERLKGFRVACGGIWRGAGNMSRSLMNGRARVYSRIDDVQSVLMSARRNLIAPSSDRLYSSPVLVRNGGSRSTSLSIEIESHPTATVGPGP